jgi:PAS domain S-box-containing protein
VFWGESEARQRKRNGMTYPDAVSIAMHGDKDVHQLVQQLAESDAALAALEMETAHAGEENTSALSPLLLSQIQHTLLQSKELLEKMLTSMQVGVAYLDPDFNYLWVNPAFARQHNCVPDDFLEKNFFQLHANSENRDLFMQAVTTGESVFFQAAASSSSAHGTRYYDRSIQPVMNQGVVSGLVYTEHDVTDRIRLEQVQSGISKAETLHLDFEMLSNLCEVDPAGLAVLVGPQFVIQFANLKFRELMLSQEIDPVGRTFREVWPDDDSLFSALPSLFNDRTALDLPPDERRFPDGTTRWYTYHLRRMNWGLQPSILIHAWECTEEHQARVQVENTAAEARQRAEELNTVISSMSEAVTIYDRNGQPVQVNPATVSAYGFDPITTPRQEALQRLSLRYLNGKPVDLTEIPSARALRGQRVRYERFVFRNFLQQDQIILVSASPLYHNGELFGAVTVWTDVTEREGLLREIKVERTRLSTLIANAPVGITAIDRDGNLLLANSMTSEMWGRTGSTGEGPRQYRLPDGSPFNLIQLANAAVRGQIQVNQEVVLRRPDGVRMHLLVNSAPILNQNGEIDGAVAIFQDITVQKQAEQKLREAKERFVVALKNSPIAVYTTDHELRYTWIYNAQYGDDSLIGRKDDELLGAENVAEMISFKQEVLDQGMGERREIPMSVGGRSFIFDVTAEPLLDEQGNVVGLTVASVDITEQKRVKDEMARNIARIEVQRRLIEQRELERQQIARDLHDGPLQDLIGIHFGLREALEIPKRRERLQKVDIIQKSLQTLIHEMRTFCSELRPPALAPFGLEKAIRSHIEAFQLKHPSIQIEPVLAIDHENLPEAVRMALYRIYQELMNNVVKHAGATAVAIRFEYNDRKAKLEVNDNGCGFLVPHDWVEIARQGHLGLVGVLERTEAVGGSIRITSKLGEGTNVTIEVPLDPINIQ